MNIFQVHNKYKIIGGEWTVLNQEYNLLKHDHNVDQYIVDNQVALATLAGNLKLILRTHYNRKSKRIVSEQIRGKNYDIMHVHNFFPLLSPSIFEAARENGVPSIMTLHNYRLIHPNGLMYHKGKIDNRSINGGSAYQCVMDGVYRNSILQTAVTAHMIEYHRKKKTWMQYPSAFIALSQFSKSKFLEGGLPEDRIFVKPNFLKDPLAEFQEISINPVKKNRFIYAGRISYEKGVEDLLKCWQNNNIDSELVIAGDGPAREVLENRSKSDPTIKWLGGVTRKEILELLSNSQALIFPTKWYEGQPLILLEALSVGCPVITSRIGNSQDIIEDGVTGLHFTPGDTADLFQKISSLHNSTEKLNKFCKNARDTYLKYYTPEQNMKRIIEIYNLAAELEKKLIS